MTDLVAALHLAKESGTMRARFSEHKGIEVIETLSLYWVRWGLC